MPRLSAAALAERARSRNQQNGELDPRYKKTLDQLNKQQQQRARLALRFCRERLRDHQGCTLPRPHVAWGVVKDGTNHRGPGRIRRAHDEPAMCVERAKPAIYI